MSYDNKVAKHTQSTTLLPAVRTHLVLEATAATTTTSLLELATLGTDERLGRAVTSAWAWAEVTDSFAGFTGTRKKDAVLTLWRLQSELIEGHDLATSLEDSGASLLSDVQSADSDLWDLEETNVIGDGAADDSGLVLTALILHLAGKAGQGHWWTVNLAHEETSQNDLIELGSGASG